MRRKFRAFKTNGRINVDNGIAGVAQQLADLPQEYEAGHGAPPGRSIREMPADVTERRGAEQRITDGMRQRIAIRVAGRALREGDPHSA